MQELVQYGLCHIGLSLPFLHTARFTARSSVMAKHFHPTTQKTLKKFSCVHVFEKHKMKQTTLQKTGTLTKCTSPYTGHVHQLPHCTSTHILRKYFQMQTSIFTQEECSLHSDVLQILATTEDPGVRGEEQRFPDSPRQNQVWGPAGLQALLRRSILQQRGGAGFGNHSGGLSRFTKTGTWVQSERRGFVIRSHSTKPNIH